MTRALHLENLNRYQRGALCDGAPNNRLERSGSTPAAQPARSAVVIE
jgi:hypothetical protein